MRYRVYQLDETSRCRYYWGTVNETIAEQVRFALTVPERHLLGLLEPLVQQPATLGQQWKAAA